MRTPALVNLTDLVVEPVRHIETRTVRCDPMWLSKLCASSGGIGVSGTTPRKGGHHSAGDHDLANSVILSVRHFDYFQSLPRPINGGYVLSKDAGIEKHI